MRAASMLLVLAACGGKGASPTVPHDDTAPARVVASNVLRSDYAGSEACADCHAEIYKKWAASPMRNMTRDATTANIRAPFDGYTLHVGNDSATMETDAGTRYVKLTTPTGTERFRVTKVVGGHYREDFVGRLGETDREHVLPATYVFSTRSWRYKGYSVMVKERPAMSTRAVWSQECIACHNTLPLTSTLYDELYGPNLPLYQGKLADRTIPARVAWGARTHDDAGLARVIADEIHYLGGSPGTATTAHALLPAAATASETFLDGTKLVELGIGCEACHNGSRAHVATPEIHPTYAVKSPLFELTPPKGQSGTRAQWINHTCAKCHTVLFTRYPYTWEGGERRSKNPGGSTTNSGEGRDFKLGGCATAMACTACHDPHTEDPRAKLDALATPAGNAVCASCHPTLAADVAAHSHHKATGAGASCVGCHMPKKNMGLDYDLVRYHRIGSPDDDRVTADRPLECALCHADKSIETLVTAMEGWWGKKYDRAALRKLYGDDLSVDALHPTITRGKPHEQAAAMAVLGHARDRTAIAAIAQQLGHDYPLVRYFALRALETITGAPVAIDVNASAIDVRRAAEIWLRANLQPTHP